MTRVLCGRLATMYSICPALWQRSQCESTVFKPSISCSLSGIASDAFPACMTDTTMRNCIFDFRKLARSRLVGLALQPCLLARAATHREGVPRDSNQPYILDPAVSRVCMRVSNYSTSVTPSHAAAKSVAQVPNALEVSVAAAT